MTESQIGPLDTGRHDEHGVRRYISRRAILGGLAAGAGAAAVTAPAVAHGTAPTASIVDAREFGVVGNGESDDTPGLQAWFTNVVTNHKQGWLPNGTYRITDTLVLPSGYGWAVHGESLESTVISQATPNIPIIQVGTADKFSHTWSIDRLFLTYQSPQPLANSNANNMVFEGNINSSFHCQMRDMRFMNGFYAMKMAPGKFGIWGSEFDNLGCSNMSGGFYDSTDTVGGCPNNRWGRHTITCDNAVGPMFKEWHGYNMSIATLEFLAASNGPQLIQTTVGGFSADIDTLKLENGTYSGAGKALFSFPKTSFVRIGSISVGGNASSFAPASGVLSIVGHVGPAGGQGYLNIGSIVANATSLTGDCVAVTAGDGARVSVGNVSLDGGWTFQSTSKTTSGDYAKVDSWVNGTLSDDLGDADYTAVPGSPNVLVFNTEFSAQRSITLPAPTDNNLCAGLYYDIIFDGAINGSNTAVIMQGRRAVRTQAVDGKKLSYRWRRGMSGGQWVLTGIVDVGP